jgi:hypothetical protein
MASRLMPCTGPLGSQAVFRASRTSPSPSPSILPVPPLSAADGPPCLADACRLGWSFSDTFLPQAIFSTGLCVLYAMTGGFGMWEIRPCCMRPLFASSMSHIRQGGQRRLPLLLKTRAIRRRSQEDVQLKQLPLRGTRTFATCICLLSPPLAHYIPYISEVLPRARIPLHSTSPLAAPIQPHTCSCEVLLCSGLA